MKEKNSSADGGPPFSLRGGGLTVLAEIVPLVIGISEGKSESAGDGTASLEIDGGPAYDLLAIVSLEGFDVSEGKNSAANGGPDGGGNETAEFEDDI
jgi:hypothetical protein